MSHRDQINAATTAGRAFAAELNTTPAEAQNWTPLGANDELPSEDYRALVRTYGEVTPEMVAAYRAAFNAEFRG